VAVVVVKRYAVHETKNWRYVVRKAKIGRYAVHMGGCHHNVLGIAVSDMHYVSCKALAKTKFAIHYCKSDLEYFIFSEKWRAPKWI